MRKWFTALLFVFACLPIVAIKAAPPQTYVHLDYEIINGYYDIGDGTITDTATWRRSNMIQIPKNVDKLYFSGWHTHFVLFFSDEMFIGFYYDIEYVLDLTWVPGSEEKILGEYDYTIDLIHALDVPTNATHLALQQCVLVPTAGLTDYLETYPTPFNDMDKPLIYYPVTADAAANITFSLMPMLMIVVVIAGLAGGLIMITEKPKR